VMGKACVWGLAMARECGVVPGMARELALVRVMVRGCGLGLVMAKEHPAVTVKEEAAPW